MTYRFKVPYEECKNVWDRKKIKDLIGQYEYCAYARRKLNIKAGQHLYIKSYYNRYIKELKAMATCKNCGEDVIKSDICGDYCVHCFDYEEISKSNLCQKRDKINESLGI